MQSNIETKMVEAMNGLVDIQRHLVGGPGRKSIGEEIVESKCVEAIASGAQDSQRFELKTAITHDQTVNHPLMYVEKPRMAGSFGFRRRGIYPLFRAFPTTAGAVEFAAINSSTNNAGRQVGASPEQFQNVTKPESAVTFTNTFRPLVTLAHFIPASRQVFEDSGVLQGMIETWLVEGLHVAVDAQLMNGAGGAGQLDGILNSAESYTVQSPQLTGKLDVLRDMLEQLQLNEYSATAFVVNPSDWRDIESAVAGSGDNTYTAGPPRLAAAPSLYGVPVVVSTAIASGTAVVGDFPAAGAIFEKGPIIVEVSRQDSDNFTRNMLTLRAEQRLALVIHTSGAIVQGSI